MFDNFEQDLILTFIMCHNECIVNRKAGIDTHLVNIMYINQYRVTNFLSEVSPPEKIIYEYKLLNKTTELKNIVYIPPNRLTNQSLVNRRLMHPRLNNNPQEEPEINKWLKYEPLTGLLCLIHLYKKRANQTNLPYDITRYINSTPSCQG